MSTAPRENLELRASQERERIHRTALELMSKVDETKEKLSPAYNVRLHFGRAAAAGSAVAFILGYAIAGAFTHD